MEAAPDGEVIFWLEPSLDEVRDVGVEGAVDEATDDAVEGAAEDGKGLPILAYKRHVTFSL